MKILKLIPVALFTLVFASCTKTEKFAVNVHLANADGKEIYLCKVVDGKQIIIDSATIYDSEAIFRPEVGADYLMYGINCKGWRRPYMFFADNKDVVIVGDYLKYYDLQITASQSQVRLDEFEKNYNAYDQKLDDIYEAIGKATDEKAKENLEAKYEKVKDDQNYYLFDQVWVNNADFVSHYILYRYKWAMQPCELRNVRANFDKNVYSPYLDLLDAYIAKLDKIEEGMPFIDFSLPDLEGNEVKLSDLVGKSELLMIDFWASWCPDCRKENPSVVNTYINFHNLGFDVMSVSLDTDKDNWQAAIVADKLIWENHVSDLKGWSNAAADIYAVVAIPSNVLLDRNGTIVAKNLSGTDLYQFVESRLK